MLPNNILVVRNDKLGDFLLTWPAIALLKKHLPDLSVSVFVPEYTAAIAELCPWIDDIIVDNKSSVISLSSTLTRRNFDAMLTLYSTSRVGLAGMLSRIPYRLSPATKFAQVFYTHRLTQRRSRSEKPEYAYNMDIVWRFLFDHGLCESLQATSESNGDWLPAEIPRPLLRFDDDTAALRESLCSTHQLRSDSRLIFVHPGTGGSANNLRPSQYAHLCNLLAGMANCSFIVTAGPGELPIAQEVVDGINGAAVVHESFSGLGEFARTMQCAELFISGSTGPLHIAGALNLNTAAFYPGHRSATPLRWQTLNAPERRLAFVPPSGSEREVQMIDIEAAARRITAHFFAS